MLNNQNLRSILMKLMSLLLVQKMEQKSLESIWIKKVYKLAKKEYKRSSFFCKILKKQEEIYMKLILSLLANFSLCSASYSANSLCGFLLYEPKMQRTIGVDVRYILFMIEKYGKAGNLIKELNIIN